MNLDSRTGSPVAISVIIPVFNGENFLPAAVESVLEQGEQSLEIIVVDDGSTDGTAAVAAGLDEHVRYFKRAHKGPSAARNYGLGMATGEFVAFLDCDDRWAVDNLSVLVDVLRREPDVDIAMGRIQQQALDPDSNRYVANRNLTFSLSLVAMLTRRTVFREVGLLDESIWIGEDKDWFIRAVEQGMTIRFLPDHVSQFHRRHDENMTNDMNAPETYWLDLIRRSLARKRAAVGKNSR